MAFSRRKLFIESIVTDTAQQCQPFCDPVLNPQGHCPFQCLSVCAQTCYNKVLPDIPLPPLPPFLLPTPPPADPPESSPNLPRRLIILFVVFAAVFSLFLCFTIYKCIAWYRNRSRRRRLLLNQQIEETHDEFHDEDHGPILDHPIWYIRTIGLQPSVISAISICKYKKGEGLIEGTECSVCLNEFQEDETLRLLPKCNHAFHIPCIDTWLGSHTNCPLCRAGIVSNLAGLPSAEQSGDNSNVLEDAHVEILVINGENGRGSEGEASEMGICHEELGESRRENRIKIDEIGREAGVSEVQLIRRSVSMDLLSASGAETDTNWGRRVVKANDLGGNVQNSVYVNKSLGRSVGSSSSGRSVQKDPLLMKRSFSYSGKVLFSRHNSSRYSVPPS